MIINKITKSPSFQGESYHKRLSSRLEKLDWWDKKFGGGTSDAKKAVEWEIRDEIDEFVSQKNAAEQDLERYKTNYNNSYKANNNKIEELNQQIDSQKELISEQNEELNSLKEQLIEYESSSNEILENLENDTDNKRQEIYKMQTQSQEIEESINNVQYESCIKLDDGIEKLKKKNVEQYNQTINDLNSSPISYLKQNIIMPLKINQAGKNLSIPNGILVETQISPLSRLLAGWVSRSSNSNYEKINGKNYQNEDSFFEDLTIIANKSRETNKQSNKHTFTLITNIEKFLKDKDAKLIPFLKSFMDTVSNDYHNTIIFATRNISKLDPILTAKHRFPVKINLDFSFLFKKKYGFFSMLFDYIKLSKLYSKHLIPTLLK